MVERQASRRSFHFIYKTIMLNTNQYYIGMHSTDDMNDCYLGSGLWLNRAIKKYGRENFKREILELLPDRCRLRQREKELVNEDLLKDPLCMNLNVGGNSSEGHSLTSKHKMSLAKIGKPGHPQTEETKQRISQKHRGKKLSDETKQKLSKINLGIRRQRNEDGFVFSPESRKRMSDVRKGVKLSDTHREALRRAHNGKARFIMTDEIKEKISRTQRGRVFSEETKKKMSEACHGRKISEETRRKLSKIHTGKIVSDETRRKISQAIKARFAKREKIDDE